MDPRVPHTMNAQREVFALGKHYPSLAAAEKAVGEIIAKREAMAGRALSSRELRDGIKLRDDMTERDKIEVTQWNPVMPPEPEGEKNPFRKARLEPREPRTRKDLMAKAEREYDAKLAREAAAAEDKADARRQKAIAHAEELWEQVAFDPSATTSDLVAVEQLRRQAQGDLKAFKAMSENIVARRAERHGEQVHAAQSEFDRARQHLEFLKAPAPYEGSQYVAPGDRVSRQHAPGKPDEIVVLRRSDDDRYDVVKHRWTADQAPADVAALAPVRRED